MKTPALPPGPENLFPSMLKSRGDQAASAWINLVQRVSPSDPYLPWDKLRYQTPPEDFSSEEWWHAIKLGRSAMMRTIPSLFDTSGRPFRFAMPDEVIRATDEIARNASGNITIGEQVTDPSMRDRYVVNSLIEEAITSSQLEGASTTRREAKKMLRAGRPPRDNSEQMIVNNYLAMQRIGELRDKPLTPDIVLEIHRIVTEGTLENPSAAGRMQQPGEDRVNVLAEDDELLHHPPDAHELPARLDALCRFANATDDDLYMPPVLRALAIHFMAGYDHYFEDGNGRTARALFYWSMLRQGYWLTEFISVSRILHGAPAQYARSFLLTEQDDSDLTHFFIYHLGVIQRAIADLHTYLAVKSQEMREVQSRLRALPGEYNHRQLAVLDLMIRDPETAVTVRSHAASHRVSQETARQDLHVLTQRGMLERFKVRKQYAWRAKPDLADRL